MPSNPLKNPMKDARRTCTSFSSVLVKLNPACTGGLFSLHSTQLLVLVLWWWTHSSCQWKFSLSQHAPPSSSCLAVWLNLSFGFVNFIPWTFDTFKSKCTMCSHLYVALAKTEILPSRKQIWTCIFLATAYTHTSVLRTPKLWGLRSTGYPFGEFQWKYYYLL